MASIVKFARPRPVIRHPGPKVALEHESREARRSLFILIGSFFITATVMCAAVVAMVSSTWTDVLIMSAFVLVFALLKIGLANALIYAMLRYDATMADAPLRDLGVADHPRFKPTRPRPATRRRSEPGRTGQLHVAISNGQPGP